MITLRKINSEKDLFTEIKEYVATGLVIIQPASNHQIVFSHDAGDEDWARMPMLGIKMWAGQKLFFKSTKGEEIVEVKLS